MTRHLHITLATSILGLLALCAPASAEDGVVILYEGGVQTLDVLELEAGAGGSLEVIDRGELQIIPRDEPPVTLVDVKVLRDDRILLTGLSNSGVAVWDSQTGELEYVWRPDSNFSQVESASVATYTPSGTPQRLLLADSVPSTVQIWDQLSQKFTWRQALFLPGARAHFTQAILLPDARVAVATNWVQPGIVGVDVIALRAEPGEAPAHIRIANRDHDGGPGEVIVQRLLDEVRDLIALDDQTFLVTTPHNILAMKHDGTIDWHIDITADPDVGGEFASARAFTSGRIAVATIEPGRWVDPHPNHRIHWYEITDNVPRRVATSAALERAVRRVEPRAGTGGTGTVGFESTLEISADGALADVEIDRELSLSSERVRRGQQLDGSVQFANTSERGVEAAKIAVLAIPDENCFPTGETRTLFEQDDVTIEPIALFELSGTLTIDESFESTTWCAFPALQSKEGEWINLISSAVNFQVLPVDEDTGYPKLPSQDLDVQTPDPEGSPDMGAPEPDMSETSPPPPTPEPERGCACAQSGVPAGDGMLAGLFGLLLLGMRRQRM